MLEARDDGCEAVPDFHTPGLAAAAGSYNAPVVQPAGGVDNAQTNWMAVRVDRLDIVVAGHCLLSTTRWSTGR